MRNKKKKQSEVEVAASESLPAPTEQKQEKRRRQDAEGDDGNAAAADSATTLAETRVGSSVGRGGRGGRGVDAGRSAGRGGGAERGRGRGGRGRGDEARGLSTKPSALRMLKPRAGRKHTISVALPASIVDNAQSDWLQAVLVGQIARALTIFSVDEVVIYEDKSDSKRREEDEGLSQSLAFFVRNLQYLETPQYLRRHLLPVHRDLKWVGLLSPLDAPHHLRRHERLPYREGAVLAADKSPAAPKGEEGQPGCWVYCGFDEPVWIVDQTIPSGVRVTVRLDDDDSQGNGARRGAAVAPREPTTKLGLYWGYQTRIAKSLRAVVDECPFEGGYDLTIGTSERGEALGMGRLPQFQHLLLALGGVGGFEEVIDGQLSGYNPGTDPATLFTRYVNICPTQTSRTIRTEEALLIALTAMNPILPEK